MLFIALERVQSLGHPEATSVYTEQLLELHRGQGMEIYWRDNFTCPSEEEYRQMTMRSMLSQAFTKSTRLHISFFIVNQSKEYRKFNILN